MSDDRGDRGDSNDRVELDTERATKELTAAIWDRCEKTIAGLRQIGYDQLSTVNILTSAMTSVIAILMARYTVKDGDDVHAKNIVAHMLRVTEHVRSVFDSVEEGRETGIDVEELVLYMREKNKESVH